MARYFELSGDEVGIKWLFNVSYPVGPKCENRRDDVMLVQHAINTLLPHLDLKKPDGKTITSYLVRDGYFGRNTREAIVAYQENLKARHKHVVRDGIVDPSSRSGWTTTGAAQYTIVYLNRDHRDFHGTMMQEEQFPDLLKSAIMNNK
jgi:hypothetical protein